jgi:hypothetical protein
MRQRIWRNAILYIFLVACNTHTHVCDARRKLFHTSPAMPNHHCLLHSLNPEYPEPPYNDALVSRFSDAGAGAFSYSMGREFTVYRDIPAGSELFLDYGK